MKRIRREGKRTVVRTNGKIEASTSSTENFNLLADRYKRYGTFQKNVKVERELLRSVEEVRITPLRENTKLRTPKKAQVVASVKIGKTVYSARSPKLNDNKIGAENLNEAKKSAFNDLCMKVGSVVAGESDPELGAEYIRQKNKKVTYSYVYYRKP